MPGLLWRTSLLR
ncbi:hypothetical protein FQN60_002624 [Etheostoma spectabile]|uniref:Uncharacterized protein n=1 Tax=Etheostoma spectabile TaxID=54343 RepID=A0A5J5CJW8_9PERO|nr:hypothetical protein FQN60_002624 [Etheostoma spectabile]